MTIAQKGLEIALEKKLHDELYDCFKAAIEEVGIENFKKCSFFLSNEMASRQLSKAA
ncbi:hypothetical protein IWQ49_006410 [Labrenzia sp. EL_126]|nr:hypothetical protein [Labrenzia sp. EL_126]